MPIANQRLMRSYYGNTAEAFLHDSDEQILGTLTKNSEFAVEEA